MDTQAYKDLTAAYPDVYMHLEMNEMKTQATVFLQRGQDLVPYTASAETMEKAVEAACTLVRAVLTGNEAA